MSEEKKTSADVEQMWEAYFADPDTENKNALLMHYLYLVKRIVLRMMPTYKNQSDYDDLLSNGVIGLMDAISKFDMLRNVKFETYASKRIQGEILDYMRKQDWISSSMRTRIKKVKQAYDSMASQTGRQPTEQEVADVLDLTPTQVKEAIDNEYMYSIIHFESVISSNTSEEPIKVIDTLQDDDEEAMPEQHLERKEMLNHLSLVLEDLPETEKLVIDLYYRKELLLKEIAQVLNVSESRVSQIHSKAIKRIQAKMQE
ncbi:FliA/WhiG family RNA polymerase sigma factor [Christensenellaceae bacterium OttesenSCG-928-K19]|nr:FliA/WhiG family RNA polymerase sigma factor [Christensenellaceae bacterium OttesenSCG-928-K19]